MSGAPDRTANRPAYRPRLLVSCAIARSTQPKSAPAQNKPTCVRLKSGTGAPDVNKIEYSVQLGE